MDLVGSGDWADFNNLFLVDAPDTFAQQSIVWRRYTVQMDRWKEDNQLAPDPVEITLKCLINYNWLRSWPITNNTESGELNQESIQVLFGKKYLGDLGYMDSGMFIYNQDYDRFVIDGKIMKAVGDTPVSQAYNSALWYSVIMVEQPTKTGNKRD